MKVTPAQFEIVQSFRDDLRQLVDKFTSEDFNPAAALLGTLVEGSIKTGDTKQEFMKFVANCYDEVKKFVDDAELSAQFEEQ